VLEEIVGPIEDEFDDEGALVRQVDSRTWELSGALPAHKLGELVGERFEECAEASTVSGLMTLRLGRFPRVGDTLEMGHWGLRVEELTGTRVARAKLTRAAGTSAGPSLEAVFPTGPLSEDWPNAAPPARTEPALSHIGPKNAP
jgi:CBS domain containing-hemolysin-like protein